MNSSYSCGDKDLGLEDEDLEVIHKWKVNGRVFLKMSKEEFQSLGLKFGPAKKLADFVKECEKKLRLFFSYKTKKDLKEVLAKHVVEDGQITDIPQFAP